MVLYQNELDRAGLILVGIEKRFEELRKLRDPEPPAICTRSPLTEEEVIERDVLHGLYRAMRELLEFLKERHDPEFVAAKDVEPGMVITGVGGDWETPRVVRGRWQPEHDCFQCDPPGKEGIVCCAHELVRFRVVQRIEVPEEL